MNHTSCAIDRTGKRVGKLVIIKRVGTNANRSALWECKCDCGNSVIVSAKDLSREHKKSCGKCGYSQQVRHDAKKFKTRDEWLLQHVLNGMKSRCYNPNNPEYHRYGGRGITICDEWLGDTRVFVDWALSHGYRQGLQIERIGNDGNYEPANCTFENRIGQMNNMSRNHRIQISPDMTMTRAECARLIGMNYERARTIGDESIALKVRHHLTKEQIAKELGSLATGTDQDES